MRRLQKIMLLFSLYLCLCTFFPLKPVLACKDIAAVGEATRGDYNLLLKVRDPSRPGPQVLCIVPKGYTYTFHHPKTGKPWEFVVNQKYIGVATEDDTIPNIVKAGMVLSEAGIAYGDADTNSNWKNWRRFAWDDFDWIRYACQDAIDEDIAVQLLTNDVVDTLHASGVSENLFVVGPKKGYLIEADSVRYDVKEIDGVIAISNYPKALWRTQIRQKRPIANTFDTTKEVWVRKGQTIHLNSLFGIRVTGISDDSVTVHQVPRIKIIRGIPRYIGNKVMVQLHERETVGDYSVRLREINGKRAKISVEYVFKAWEDVVNDIIQTRYGDITVEDMMNWSRLHEDDMDGLRPLCEDLYPFESVMIFQIPTTQYKALSLGWFAANHACSSIYVPVHIADNEIYSAYASDRAATLCKHLLEEYGHGKLIPYIQQIEQVFLRENRYIDTLASVALENNSGVGRFLTSFDNGMQEQAFITQTIWSDITTSEISLDEIKYIWNETYFQSLVSMQHHIETLQDKQGTTSIISQILTLAKSICHSWIQAATELDLNVSQAITYYSMAEKHLDTQDFSQGFNLLTQAYNFSRNVLHTSILYQYQTIGANDQDVTTNQMNVPLVSIAGIVIVILVIVVIVLRKKINK